MLRVAMHTQYLKPREGETDKDNIPRSSKAQQRIKGDHKLMQTSQYQTSNNEI